MVARKASGVILGYALVGASMLSYANEVKLQSDVQKASYGIGQRIGQSMKSQGVEVDVDALAASIKDVLEGKPSRLKDEEINAAMTKMQESMEKKIAALAEQNKKASDKYLADNKKAAGVKTTASGLQYKIIKEGTGESPKADSEVKVHYRGTLIDGSEFDSSYKRKEPAVFPVKGVIAGWSEALMMMKKGAKWELTIPSQLAYGDRGTPGIPPNSVLKFEVELLDIMPVAKAAAPAPKATK